MSVCSVARVSRGTDGRSVGECGVFVTADGTVMLLASLATPGVDVLSIDGRLQDTLWPAKQGDTTICVKAVSSHSGFFSNVNGVPAALRALILIVSQVALLSQVTRTRQ